VKALATVDRIIGGETPAGRSTAPIQAGVAMRRVALMYNPASGQSSRSRKTVIDNVLSVLRSAGVEVEALETTAPGSAGAQAMEAVSRGCDTILACGGDGTVHEILQCLVGTPAALGVVPLGTANALAANLGLGSSPSKAIRLLLRAIPTRVPVGRIYYRDAQDTEQSRYFTVAAGVGADALFISHLDPRLKQRFGYALYVLEGLRVWATHSFPLFKASFRTHGSKQARVEEVSQILAVRIRDFGGILRDLAPGATLRKDRLQLIAFKTRNRMHFLGFLLAIVCRRKAYSDKVELLDAVTVECRQHEGSSARVYVEADGEFLGALPVKIEIVPDALTLLIPHHARP